MTDHELDALAALRHHWLQAGGAYPGGDAARSAHRDTLVDLVKYGFVRVFRHTDHSLGAAVLTRHEPQSQAYCAPLTTLMAHHDNSMQAIDWLGSTLCADVPGLADDVECMVPAADTTTLTLLKKAGLGPNTVSLAGRVDLALERLVARWNPPADLHHLGLSLERVRPADADAIIALQARVFGEEPAYAWFMVHKGWQQRRRDEILRGEIPDLSLIIRVRGEVSGLIEGRVRDRDVHHGSSVGIGLVLDPELRGKGIALVGYRRCLELARARGAIWIKGTTGRRSVLHMAELMGRRATGVIMRRWPRFDDGRFEETLGEARQVSPHPPAQAPSPPGS
ncbi:MAG: GNAT family N-acetyltransferase [Oligoflexia bacterium]|nr:GNAT family N-acetyltransferase [Oligoflexia bacterium]